MDFRTLLFLSFGDDIPAAAAWLGVSVRTLYRWYAGTVKPPLMALRLLGYRARGFDLDAEPFSSWRVYRGVMSTPYGHADVFEFERYPVIRKRMYDLDEALQARDRLYSNLFQSIDRLLLETEKIKVLRASVFS